MLILCNTRRFRQATGWCALLPTLFALLLAVPADGQDSSVSDQVADFAAPKVDWTDAQRAFSLVEEWIRSGTVPRANLPKIMVTGVIGVKITLRTDGYTLGEGQAMRPDLAAATDRPGPAVDLVPLLNNAARAAMLEVRESLADARLNAVLNDLLDPGDARAMREQVGDQLLVDLQIGYNLQTIRVSPDAPPQTVFGRFAFDAQGLRMLPPGTRPNDADAPGAIDWPASSLARNIQPGSQINGMLAELDLGLGARDRVGRPEGPVLQRFDVLHRVRPSLDQAVVQLVRGNVPVTSQSINNVELTRFGQRIFAHLDRRFVNGAVRGTYHPTTGRYDPLLAEPREIAFAAYAIQRYRRFLGEDASGSTRSAAERGAVEVTALGHAMRADDWATFDPAVASLVVLALLETDEATRDNELIAALAERLALGQPGEALPRPVLALSVAAQAAYAKASGDARLGQRAHLEFASIWLATQEDPEVLSLYWLALAHEKLADVPLGDTIEDTRAGDAVGLGDLVDKLIRQQVIEPPELGPDDVLGGFVLQRIAPGAPPTPDWRTSPLLGFLAVSMRDERITAGRDTFGWLLTSGLAARFVAQLTMDRPSLFYARGPEDALGGVRLALWNNTLAIEPSAASLLAIVELQKTIAILEARQ